MNSIPEAPRRMTRVMTRSRQIARIKGMVKRLNWTDRRYRAALENVLHLGSLKYASREQREAFTGYLEIELSPREAPYSAAELDRIVNADSIESLLA